jgi:hypothetical protein
MRYNRYLEAFYRGYSRRTFKGRDNVYYGYIGNYRVSRWNYLGSLIAVVLEDQTIGAHYLLLRQPNSKSRKAIFARLESILSRYSLTSAFPWTNGSVLFYLPGINRAAAQEAARRSIFNRIKEIWNA